MSCNQFKGNCRNVSKQLKLLRVKEFFETRFFRKTRKTSFFIANLRFLSVLFRWFVVITVRFSATKHFLTVVGNCASSVNFFAVSFRLSFPPHSNNAWNFLFNLATASLTLWCAGISSRPWSTSVQKNGPIFGTEP